MIEPPRPSLIPALRVAKVQAVFEEIYRSGEYLETNPDWHVDESPWKARQVLRILERNRVKPRTICDVGCGAGEVLRQLQQRMDAECTFWGYDISPVAVDLCRRRENARLHCRLGDLPPAEDGVFDLILVLDVIEHLEDYFALLRAVRSRGEYKVFHVPLDISVQTVLRRNGLLKRRDLHAHLHYFTKELVLRVLADVGYTVLDYVYTPFAVDLTRNREQWLMKLPRRLLHATHEDLAARILGGYGLMVLAR